MMAETSTMGFESWTSRAEPAFRVYRGVSRQPNWVARATLTVFLLVLAIPIIGLILIAGLISAVVFGCLVGWVMLRQFVARLFGRGPGTGVSGAGRGGRRNVRVIRRDE